MTGLRQKRRVFLIGFMGAGKTSVGRALAQRLGWNFYDLDEMIENRERRTIAAIFDESGERAFREIESAALIDLLHRSEDGSVAALGGGTFAQPRNRKALEQVGAVTVLLTAPLEELERRCTAAAGVRPLTRSKAEFDQLFTLRQEVYTLAGFEVNTLGKEIAEVAEEIEKILQNAANSN